MTFTGPAEERLMIRERIDSYADATFRRDRDAWLGQWTEDGVWAVTGTETCGRDALRARWDLLWSRIDRMAFFNQIGSIEVDGAQARARCYCREIVRWKDGRVWKVVGVYTDQLVRRGHDWLFARRDYDLFIDER